MPRRALGLLVLLIVLVSCGGSPTAVNPTSVAQVTATDAAIVPPPTDTGSLDCGSSEPVKQKLQQIRQFTNENTEGGLKGAFVRSVAFDSYNRAVWMGYGLGAGVGNFDGTNWRFCMKLQHVNAMLVLKDGTVLAGTDRQSETEGEPHGLWVLRNGVWQDYSASLPDSRVFGIYDQGDQVLVATWEGVARVDLNNHGPWEVVYSTQVNGVSNHIHTMLKDKGGDIWLGSVANGVYWYSGGKWNNLVCHDCPGTANTPSSPIKGTLPGNNIRKIIQAPDGKVWIAIEAIRGDEAGQGGGITSYSPLGGWISYSSDWNGGADRVMDVAVDPSGRIWMASKDRGTLFLEGRKWVVFDSNPSNALAFGNGNIYIGTDGFGLVVAPLP